MKFYGQNLQDEFIYNNYFYKVSGGLIVEAGAFDGVIESTSKFFEDTMQWNCIHVEAYPWAFNQLLGNRPNSTNIGMGLSDKKQILEFTQYDHPELGKSFGNGSFSHAEWHKKSLLENNCVPIVTPVECERYDVLIDDIVAKKYNYSNVDLFVLDVEGYELTVIDGMTQSKFLPKVICVEFPIVTIEKLNMQLGALGYNLDKTYMNNAFYLRN